MTGRPHGYARYKLDGCRCYVCGLASSRYEENRAKAITAGTWHPYVDAEPARQHVQQLKLAGVGDRTIARLADVDRNRVRQLLHGRSERGTPPPKEIRPQTAAALLSVDITLDVLPAHLPVDATGTRRRLQALGARGWPQARLAARIGVLPSNYKPLLERTRVTAAMARNVRALYEELWRSDPREHGVDAQAYSRALNAARANGWAPVGCWDDDTIDEPSAFPDWTGSCGTPDGHRAHKRLRIRPVCQSCKDAQVAESTAAVAA